jgi:N-glycosylase/DNA lyase
MAEKQYHTFISKITKTSPYGFQLAETGEESWINYGKFYEGNKEFEVGQELVVSCTESNGKYYVNKIKQSCLKVALDFHVKITEHGDTSTEEDVIKSAEKFVSWVVSK